ncbi:MAG: hypothetical protein ACON38_04365 [Akkermansiaceae bacterium]
MIENIRKYTGLMIVVLVLLFIGLVFLGDNVGNTFSGKPVMEVDGRGVSQKEFQRNAVDVQRIARELPMNGPLPRETRILASHYLGEDVIESPYLTSQSIIQQMGLFLDPTPTRLLANRIAVQKAGIEYGVTPSDEQVESFVENVIFADSEGNFDQDASREFFEEKAGKLGIGTRGFNEYIRDLLTAQNLFKLIGGGLAPEMETVRALYDSSQQKISAKQVSLSSAKFEAEVAPTEDEIKAYYEENKESYNSDEQRKISYIFVEPDWAAKLKEVEDKKAADAKKKAEEEAKLKAQAEEAKKAAEKANAEKEGKPDGTTEEEAPETGTPESTESKPETDTSTGEAETTEAPAPETSPIEEPATTEEGSQGQTGEPGEPAPAEEPVAENSGTAEADPAKPGDAPTPGETPKPAEEPAAPAENNKEEVPEAGKPTNTLSVEGEEGTKPTETEKTAEPGKPAEPVKPTPTIAQTPKDKLSPTERTEAVTAMNPELTEFDDAIIESMGADFDKVAAEKGYKIIQSEPFTKAKAPEPFNTRVTNDAVGTLADATFKLPADGSTDEKITAPYQTADGWYIIRLEEVIASQPLSYEEAKSEATADLKKKLARELLAKKAAELHETLEAAVKEGKSFADVAKENDYPAVDLPDVSMRTNATTFGAAQFTTPGEVAPLKLDPTEETPDRALIVLVEKREVLKDAAYSTGLENSFNRESDRTRYIAFQNWLYDQYIANNVQVAEAE